MRCWRSFAPSSTAAGTEGTVAERTEVKCLIGVVLKRLAKSTADLPQPASQYSQKLRAARLCCPPTESLRSNGAITCVAFQSAG
jgi:hypothetical protein